MGLLCVCVCVCLSDVAGGKAKLAIVSKSAWQLHGPSMTFCWNERIKQKLNETEVINSLSYEEALNEMPIGLKTQLVRRVRLRLKSMENLLFGENENVFNSGSVVTMNIYCTWAEFISTKCKMQQFKGTFVSLPNKLGHFGLFIKSTPR